ncbi:MAG: DUF1259 domain-containing protein [Gammaproteobacteria bacterium]|nr:DUF1259 domain-containing protein [Gammaproteobacteria bacterium]
MKLRNYLFIILISIYSISSYAYNTSTQLHPRLIEKLTGITGSFDSQKKVYTLKAPRTDLTIVLNGVSLIPAMGLTSRVSFSKDDDDTLVKATLVLTENQVNAVMTKVLDNHFTVIGLHNHFLWETPKVMFMHIEGKGEEKKLAMAINNIFNKIKDSSHGNGDFPLAMIDASTTTLDSKALDRILGVRGSLSDGAYTVTVNKIRNKTYVSDLFNPHTSAIFAGSNEAAVVDGDFVMKDDDLQNVLTVLHQTGIAVVSLREQVPTNSYDKRVVLVHYWGVGKAETLAKGVHLALAKMQDSDATSNSSLSPELLSTLINSQMPNCGVFSIDHRWCWRS